MVSRYNKIISYHENGCLFVRSSGSLTPFDGEREKGREKITGEEKGERGKNGVMRGIRGKRNRGEGEKGESEKGERGKGERRRGNGRGGKSCKVNLRLY